MLREANLWQGRCSCDSRPGLLGGPAAHLFAERTFGGRKRERQHVSSQFLEQNFGQAHKVRGQLTCGDVGGGVGVGQARHLAGDAGLTRSTVAAEVRNPR